MLHALGAFAVLSLVALWSLAVWALHAVAVWTVSNASAVQGALPGVPGLRLPDWLAPWVPPELAQAMSSLLAGLAPAFESLLQAAPALAGGLSVASWVVWGLGCALLLLLGAGLHVAIAMWGRRSGSSGSAPAHAASPS